MQVLRGILEGDGMRHLVLVLGKVEILNDGGQLCLFGGVAVNADFEFTPTFIFTEERSFREACAVETLSAVAGMIGRERVTSRDKRSILWTGFSKVGCRL